MTETVVLINTIVPRPGHLDQVIEYQLAAQKRFSGKPPGWLSSRLHVAEDGSRVMAMATFESIAAHQAWLLNPEFLTHREGLEKLATSIEPLYYRVVAGANAFSEPCSRLP